MSNLNPILLSETIQLAVAPVFLLTAVAGMIGALTQRLARVIDRSRALQVEILYESTQPIKPSIRKLYDEELVKLAQRARLVNTSMVFLVLCAIQIALTILELFLGETSDGKLTNPTIVLYTFVGGVVSFVLALIFLLLEVLIASYSVRMRPPKKSIDD